MIGDDDRWLLEEGTHMDLHDVLGAHVHDDGTRFRVWAPNADRVTLIGDFNQWDPAASVMVQGDAGVWELDVPGVGAGQRYKFHLERHGWQADKADPMALHGEMPPATASVTWQLDYDWGDGEWIEQRSVRQRSDAPMSIYEMHLGSWHGPTRYRDLAAPLTEWLARQGYTHVEFLPPMEHPFYGSWGYHTVSYFAPTSRYGVPQDFMYLIDTLHQAGIGVVLDWVPSHFPMDAHGPVYFDGTHLYEPADSRLGYQPDWGSAIFDYARPQVRSFLLSSANFWIDRYHADGLRVDAVASMLYRDYSRPEGEWVPNELGGREHLEAIAFLRQLNESLSTRHDGVQTFAEESTAWPGVSRPAADGGLGFGYKWDMGWMNDTLRYLEREPVHRAYHHNELTFRAMYAGNENFVLPLSHDEVVYGKGSLLDRQPGDEWRRFAGLRLLFGHQWTTPGKKLLFMGGDFASPQEWNHDGGLPWHLLHEERHAGVAAWVADLNRVYRREPALHVSDDRPDGFRWVVVDDAAASTIAFLRCADDARPVLVISNFTPEVWTGYRFGVPQGGRWEELLNSDALAYGGSGVGNLGAVVAEDIACHDQAWSVSVVVPPLATVMFAPMEDDG